MADDNFLLPQACRPETQAADITATGSGGSETASLITEEGEERTTSPSSTSGVTGSVTQDEDAGSDDHFRNQEGHRVFAAGTRANQSDEALPFAQRDMSYAVSSAAIAATATTGFGWRTGNTWSDSWHFRRAWNEACSTDGREDAELQLQQHVSTPSCADDPHGGSIAASSCPSQRHRCQTRVRDHGPPFPGCLSSAFPSHESSTADIGTASPAPVSHSGHSFYQTWSHDAQLLLPHYRYRQASASLPISSHLLVQQGSTSSGTRFDQRREDSFPARRRDDIQVVGPEPRLLSMPPATFSLIVSSIPEFDGSPSTCITTWCKAFRLATRHMTEYETMLALTHRLKHHAAAWLLDEMDMEGEDETHTKAADWLNRLEDHYAQSLATKRKNLKERKQEKNESASVFAADLHQLLSSYDPNMREVDQVFWLRKQLHPDYLPVFDLKFDELAGWEAAVQSLTDAMEHRTSRHAASTAAVMQASEPPFSAATSDAHADSNADDDLHALIEATEKLTAMFSHFMNGGGKDRLERRRNHKDS